jgi:transcriptional regulator with XRE-family HTH domain
MSRILCDPAILDHEGFGWRLKHARKREGFASVDALSAFLAREGVFISTRSLRRYEQGSHLPSCELLAALFKALPSDRGAFYFSSIVRDNPDPYRRVGLASLFESFPA